MAVSLLSSRGGFCLGRKFRLDVCRQKGNNTAYSSKLSFKKAFQFMAYVFGESVISHYTSWIVMYKDWSN